MRNIKQKFLLLLVCIATALFASCSGSFWTFEKCFNCDEGPLIYQGTITNITGGRYIHSVCLTADLGQAFSSSGSFFAGAEFQVIAKIKQGNFCDPLDESTYEIRVINSPFDSGEETKATLPGSAFTKPGSSTLNPGKTIYAGFINDEPNQASIYIMGIMGLLIFLTLDLAQFRRSLEGSTWSEAGHAYLDANAGYLIASGLLLFSIIYTVNAGFGNEIVKWIPKPEGWDFVLSQFNPASSLIFGFSVTTLAISLRKIKSPFKMVTDMFGEPEQIKNGNS